MRCIARCGIDTDFAIVECDARQQFQRVVLPHNIAPLLFVFSKLKVLSRLAHAKIFVLTFGDGSGKVSLAGSCFAIVKLFAI